jgi:hypothetical protein
LWSDLGPDLIVYLPLSHILPMADALDPTFSKWHAG